MRDGTTYRATRRNVARDEPFNRLSGDSWKKAFDPDTVKYVLTAPVGDYWPNEEDARRRD